MRSNQKLFTRFMFFTSGAGRRGAGGGGGAVLPGDSGGLNSFLGVITHFWGALLPAPSWPFVFVCARMHASTSKGREELVEIVFLVISFKAKM